jgi:hypothetical protein
MWTRALLLGAVGLASGSVTGCAQERAPINQVQADALAKSFFVGPNLQDTSDDPEFYMRGTIIDVGYGAGQDGLFTSTYAQPISRIRWEITEDTLNARLSYERVAGTDGKGNEISGLVKKTSQDGQIVAAYKITSHFDIRRAYNPTTGEEQNLVVENTTDRPWYQREYFRVDWSQNLATDAYDYDTLTALGWIGGIEYEPFAYTVLDPNDVDAPHWDAENGYFDVTNKAFAKPAEIDLSSLGWGIDKIPACMLPGEFAGGTSPYGDCNPIEITIRQSFRKVVDHDYIPKDYDGVRFNAFGAFTTERTGYSRNYGMTDQNWYRFASRYNLWEHSHAYGPDGKTGSLPCNTFATTEQPTGDPNADPNRDNDHDGTADECQLQGAPQGSQCDIFNNKCTLPYQQRQTVVIPWYINGANTDQVDNLNAQIAATSDSKTKQALQAQLSQVIQQGEDLFEATEWAVEEWDIALRTAVQTARLTECRRTAGTNCDTQWPMWVGQQEDNEAAVQIAREVGACRRKAALGSTDPSTIIDSSNLEKQRAAAWTTPNDACAQIATQMANDLATERKDPADPSAAAIGQIVGQNPILVLCHNPVIESDHPACGALGLSPRLGDIRYNTVLNIPSPQTPSAWGIMVDADDPLTGEKVAASINIWTAVTDIASQQLVDLVKYVNGELSVTDITNGKYIDNWAQAAKLGTSRTPTMTKEQVHQRIAAAGHVSTAQFEEGLKKGLDPAITERVKQFHYANVPDVAISHDVPSPSAYGVQSRMNMMRNTPAEATLINQPMLQAAGINGNTIPPGTALDQASPMALNNPRVMSMLTQMKQNAMAARGACILEGLDSAGNLEMPEFSAVGSIAKAMLRKFPRNAQTCSAATDCASNQCNAGHCQETAQESQNRYDAMVNYVRRRYQYAVLAHEMGHSVGLRHNFVSSSAALHYRPQYWQLRTNNGAMTTPCTDAVTDGSTCVGPRYFDPLTQVEQDEMIWMYMQSTVMDYPGDVSQDTLGLGAYDFAAARMFYGDVVSLYDVKDSAGKLDPKYLSGGQIGVGITNTTDNFGGLVGIQYQVKGGTPLSTNPSCTGSGTPCIIHYSELQAQYNLISKCNTTTPTQPTWWRESVDGKWDELWDGHFISLGGVQQGPYTRCRQLPVDYAQWGDLRVPNSYEIGGGYYSNAGAPSVDNATKRLRVPYSFASDDWADTGNVSVFRHDNGADPYEQTTFLITTQEDRHILDNFRRGRNTFNVRAAADRSYSRYNEKLLDIAGGIGFLSNIYQDFSTQQGYTFDSLWPFIIDLNYRGNMIGATVAMDHFTNELSRPESGQHFFPTAGLGDASVLLSANDPDGNPNKTWLVIPEGSTGYEQDVGFGGHLLENALSMSNGDYDVNYTENAGSYYDKIHTAILLSLSEDRFISQSRQDFYDARFRAVGMADVLPDGWRRVIANSLTGDRAILAPQVTATNGVPDVINTQDPNDPTNKDSLQYPKNPLLWKSWWPQEGPILCGPSNGSNVCTSFESDFLGGNAPGFNQPVYGSTLGVDPQVGWEAQKFMIAWTLAYIPADWQAKWVDMMRIYRLGQNADPQLNERIEWVDPASGDFYYAPVYGKECLFGPSTATDQASCATDSKGNPTGGKWVQKGIAARVLEYANFLTSQAYLADPAYAATGGFNQYGRFVFATQPDGTPVVAADPAMHQITPEGNVGPAPVACDQSAPVDCCSAGTTVAACASNPMPATSACPATSIHPFNCTPLSIYDNHWAVQLAPYKEVVDYLWTVVIQYQLGSPNQLGVFP